MAKCKCRSATETNLTCNKCGDPICPKCMVQTPVGARCPSCAKLSRIPTYRVSGIYYLRAIGAALGLAVVCGLLWGLVRLFVPFFLLSLVIGGAAGYGIGEGIGLSVNRKRGTGLAVIGALAVIAAYLVSYFTFGGRYFALIDIAAVVIGIFVSVTRLR
jgi:hypothetical protein